MASVPDPYRTLGLARGASLDEVKRAYRRLVKVHHPDSAGERALPRFLEIQAAYEQLVGPTRRGAMRAAGPGSGRAPWQADDRRADATRRAYGARARGSAARGPRPAAGERTRPGADRPGTERPRGTGRQRPPNKATPGSTTYDGAEDQPFEPDWTGGSWYGTSSGTYWTLNPREYADPRKHGPEYQARARRARETAARAGAGDDGPGDAGPTDAGPSPAGATRPSSAWWSASSRGAASTPETEATPNAGPAGPGRAEPPPPAGRDDVHTDPPDPFQLLGALERALVQAPRRSPAARLAYAVVGGTPVALGIGWLLGELTGCGRFSASCDPGIGWLGWLAGLAIVALLALVPRIASIAAVGTVAMVLAAVPATVFLSATGGARQPGPSGAALSVVLAAAWIAGVAYAIGRRHRSEPVSGPVS